MQKGMVCAFVITHKVCQEVCVCMGGCASISLSLSLLCVRVCCVWDDAERETARHEAHNRCTHAQPLNTNTWQSQQKSIFVFGLRISLSPSPEFKKASPWHRSSARPSSTPRHPRLGALAQRSAVAPATSLRIRSALRGCLKVGCPWEWTSSGPPAPWPGVMKNTA